MESRRGRGPVLTPDTLFAATPEPAVAEAAPARGPRARRNVESTPARPLRRGAQVAAAELRADGEGVPSLERTIARRGSQRRTARTADGVIVAGSTPSEAVPSRAGAWERHADRGTSLYRDPAMDPAVGQLPRRGGTILSALARASTPEEVVQVILDRSDGLRSVGQELPEPAVRLVERIVRIQDETTVLSANVVPESDLAPLSSFAPAPSATASARRGRGLSRTAPARRADGAGASQVTKLAGKLMKLIHLAENERKLADAQRHVRMAQEDGKAEAGKETGPSESAEAPNLKALQVEVFEAVLRELELSKQRRQEDFDVSVWW